MAGKEPDESGWAISTAQNRRRNECRFGFAQALREWPENVEASDGIVDATLLFGELHVARHEYAAAAALLNELRSPDPRFVARIEALRAEDALDVRDERVVVLLVDDRLQPRVRLLKRRPAERVLEVPAVSSDLGLSTRRSA